MSSADRRLFQPGETGRPPPPIRRRNPRGGRPATATTPQSWARPVATPCMDHVLTSCRDPAAFGRHRPSVFGPAIGEGPLIDGGERLGQSPNATLQIRLSEGGTPAAAPPRRFAGDTARCPDEKRTGERCDPSPKGEATRTRDDRAQQTRLRPCRGGMSSSCFEIDPAQNAEQQPGQSLADAETGGITPKVRREGTSRLVVKRALPAALCPYCSRAD